MNSATRKALEKLGKKKEECPTKQIGETDGREGERPRRQCELLLEVAQGGESPLVRKQSALKREKRRGSSKRKRKENALLPGYGRVEAIWANLKKTRGLFRNAISVALPRKGNVKSSESQNT